MALFFYLLIAVAVLMTAGIMLLWGYCSIMGTIRGKSRPSLSVKGIFYTLAVLYFGGALTFCVWAGKMTTYFKLSAEPSAVLSELFIHYRVPYVLFTLFVLMVVMAIAMILREEGDKVEL